MVEFPIDCPLLLRLGFELGTAGLYRLSTAGIESNNSIYGPDDAPWKGPETALLLEFIRDARLPLPTTSTQLAEWLAKNDDIPYVIPHWFEPVVASQDATGALAILIATQTAPDEAIEADERVANALRLRSKRAPSAIRSEHLMALREAREKLIANRGEREAIQLIRALLPSSSSMKARKAADASHENDRKVRAKALRLFREAGHLSKAKAAEVIAPQVNRSATTVRKWLQGVDR